MRGVSKVLNINGNVVTVILGGEVKQVKCRDEADIIAKFSENLTAAHIRQLKGIKE